MRPLCENCRMMLKRARGIGVSAGAHGCSGNVVCSQSCGESLWMAGEYRSSSRNFANETRLFRAE